MNLAARAKSSAHLILHYHLPRKCLFVSHPMNSLQRSIFYSTRTAKNTQKTQQSGKPRTQNSSDSSVSFSEMVKMVKKEAEALPVWPRPREIPYQAKVANFVNIIGYVNNPVKFEVDSDGKHWAATVISHERGSEKNSLLIPVVFEGDLAHVVACHVKENDIVFVCGQLSTEPMRLGFSESLGRFHVVGENLNFVEGLKRNVLDYVSKEKGAVTSGVEIGKPISPVTKKLEEVKIYSNGGDGPLDKKENPFQTSRNVLPYWKTKSLGVKNELESSNSVGDLVKLSTNTDSKVGSVVQLGNDSKTVYKDKSEPEKGNETSGDSASKINPWRDLVINPLLWWDYREHKANGLVKAKFPDFKHKATGESLWVNSAPEWVVANLGNLDIDVKIMKAKPVQGDEWLVERKMDVKGDDDSWKNLVENPDKWWDNRSNKRNPKSPDFKHKETGEVLWLSRSPDWALSRIPPLKDVQNSRSL